MITVLVIGITRDHFNLFSNQYGHLSVHFSWSPTMKEAMAVLKSEQPSFIFFISSDIEELLVQIREYNENNIITPYICFSPAGSWEIRKKIWDAGAVDYIRLPIHYKELEYILKNQIIRAGIKKELPENQIQGKLQDFSFRNLIQIFENQSRSGCLYLNQDGSSAKVYFEKGQLIDAEYGDCDPLEAVTVVSTWKTGAFSLNFEEIKRKKQIILDNHQLLYECDNYVNRQKELINSLPDFDVQIFAAPEIDPDDCTQKDHAILLKFKKGLTLESFLKGLPGNINIVLTKVLKLIQSGRLLEESQFELVSKYLQEKKEASAFKKIFEKLFSANSKNQLIAESTPTNNKTELEYTLMKKEQIFNGGDLVKKLLNKLEETDNEDS